MTSDEKLAEIRDLCRRLHEGSDGSLTWDEEHSLAGLLAENFTLLDEDLCSGCEPPLAWAEAFDYSGSYYADADRWPQPRREETVHVQGELL